MKTSLLSRFIPQTLLFRTFLLVALLLLAAAGGWATLARLSEAEPRARHLAELAATMVNLTRTALINVDSHHRLELLNDLSSRESMHIYPAETDDRIEPLPDSLLFAYLREDINLLLGQQTRLAYAVNGDPGFWVSFALDEDAQHTPEDEYWIRLPRDRVDRPPALRWGGFALVVLLISLMGAYLIVAHLTRPLSQMARMCLAVGRGEQPPLLDEVGPDELRILAASLNRMTANLAQMEKERAEVLAGISHDMRTPLTRLRLGLEMSGTDSTLMEYMTQDIEVMDAMLGQFLDYSRGVHNEEIIPSDPISVIERIAHRYGDKVALTSSATALSYPLRLKSFERAITNLIDNGLKYGNPPIEISVSETTSPMPAGLKITVRDHGPGIPDSEFERIKQPFMRLESSRTGIPGTGLGLAIVERIIHSHHGKLHLYNHPEGGLCAEIHIPSSASAPHPHVTSV